MARQPEPANVTPRLRLSRGLRERHYNTAGELLGTGVFTQFHSDLEAEFDALDELLRGIAAVGESRRVPPTMSRLTASCYPARLCARPFPQRGLDADSGRSRECIVTEQPTRAVPLIDETNEQAHAET